MHDTTHKRTARIITGVCGSLFAIFSVLYLYLMQPDLLATAQHLMSKGVTRYAPVWGALIITTVLLLLLIPMKRICVLPLRFHALYFFPSSLLLGILTSIVPLAGWSIRTTFDNGLLYSGIIIFLLILWGALHYPDVRDNRNGMAGLLWPNLLLLAVQFCMAASLGNTDKTYHYRLQAERLVAQGDDVQALAVGNRSLAADRSLTALRAFALSRTGQMGERLFEYPQYYGSEGLLPEPSDTVSLHGYPSLIYRHLNGRPGYNITDAAHFLRVMSRYRPSKAVGDYYLCSCLLDKDLDAFVQHVPMYYTLNDSLPRHYKEALVLYKRLHTNPSVVYEDAVTDTNYSDFLQFRSRYTKNAERSNQCRRMFGTTYWWYYYYQPVRK